MAGTCSREDCDRPAITSGFCKNHYKAHLRHKRGAKPRNYTRPGAPLAFINEVAIPSNQSECLPWPFARGTGGYGLIVVDGVRMTASRYVCLRTHGEPPTPEHEAAHSCNNGHEACVNPTHLSWQTRAENMEHKIESGNTSRGTKNPRNVLSEDQVREIRRLKGTIGARKIGLQFGVCETTILNIHRGTKWGWLP